MVVDIACSSFIMKAQIFEFFNKIPSKKYFTLKISMLSFILIILTLIRFGFRNPFRADGVTFNLDFWSRGYLQRNYF